MQLSRLSIGWTSQKDPRIVKHENGRLGQRLAARQVKGTADVSTVLSFLQI